MAYEYSVITRKRRRKLCLASSDPDRPLAPVAYVALGSGGTGEDGEPLTPLEDQSTLNCEIARYSVENVVYPEETTARYTVMIPEGALTGQIISEAALIDGDGDLVAVKNMYPKRKDADVAFKFEFDDEF